MDKFPDWGSLTCQSVREELPKLIAKARSDFAEHEKLLATLDGEKLNFATVVEEIEDITRPVWRLWGRVAHLLSVMNSDEWRKIESDFQGEIVALSLEVSQSKIVYEAIRKLMGKSPSGAKGRILEKGAQAAELAGVALEGDKKKRFNEICERLAVLSSDFSNSVIDSTKAFKFEKDGKTWTIDDAAYPQAMKHCADREVREKLYRARATRSGDNTARITEILSLRKEMASLLGFADYASLSLATKCAPSAEAVFKMIDELDEATREKSRAEDLELGENLEPWDFAFAAERLREKTYSYSEEELKKYFEFEDTLHGLFRLVLELFGLDVEEVTGEEKPSVWHEDVRFFRLLEDGQTIAHFYLDPYVRPGLKSSGAWMNEFQNRSSRLGEKPLALMVLNLPAKDAEGKCFMPFREVETLFHEFGHALQCMATRVEDEGAAGISLVEWDAVEVASQFMENWCLDARTGIELPKELNERVKKARNFRAASVCRRQLAFAKTDMLLHGEELPSDANETKNEMFRHFSVPMIENDLFLNSFAHIFSGGYAAGYYGYKWSEVMSADVYGAFEEASKIGEEAVKETGKQYRETILALGGSESAWEVFKRFRKREPRIEALLVLQGLR